MFPFQPPRTLNRYHSNRGGDGHNRVVVTSGLRPCPFCGEWLAFLWTHLLTTTLRGIILLRAESLAGAAGAQWSAVFVPDWRHSVLTFLTGSLKTSVGGISEANAVFHFRDFSALETLPTSGDACLLSSSFPFYWRSSSR